MWKTKQRVNLGENLPMLDSEKEKMVCGHWGTGSSKFETGQNTWWRGGGRVPTRKGVRAFGVRGKERVAPSVQGADRSEKYSGGGEKGGGRGSEAARGRKDKPAQGRRKGRRRPPTGPPGGPGVLAHRKDKRQNDKWGYGPYRGGNGTRGIAGGGRHHYKG